MTAATTLPSPATFRHGVHPDDRKELTRGLPLERFPFVDEYTLPLAQHIGAPAAPVVAPGRKVRRGELIAKPGGFVSTAIHAPVTGEVTAIELRPHPTGKMLPAIVIRADPYASQQTVFSPPPPLESLSLDQAVSRIQEAGLVGMGGAAFPTHVKLKAPKGKKVRLVMLNGCECEPYLTCDHRVMVERPEAVIRGLVMLLKVLGVENGYVGVEINKPDAIEALREQAGKHPSVEVIPLKVKYPQGAEKMLINAVFAREVPSGKLPIDLEIVVQNVATSAALADFFDMGKPLIERAITVSGDAARRPGNFMVPLGTPLRALLEHCGGLGENARRVIMGGPMMGMAQKNLDVPVMKGTSGVLALSGPSFGPENEEACIRCGRCLEGCPMFLNPSHLAALVRAERVDALEEHHLLDCFECASCSFVCPSRIPLVQLMRMGKAMLRNRKTSP